MSIRQQFLSNSIEIFKSQKRKAEGAIAQLSNAQLHQDPFEDGNSIVVQMKHLSGNMRSRWTDFLTSDGEKPDRGRDGEFIDDFESREQLDESWEGGWAVLLSTMNSLTAEDLDRSVTIRGESHSPLEAIQRQIAHYGYHVGQIVQLARSLAGDKWQTLSVARGASKVFNESLGYEAK